VHLARSRLAVVTGALVALGVLLIPIPPHGSVSAHGTDVAAVSVLSSSAPTNSNDLTVPIAFPNTGGIARLPMRIGGRGNGHVNH
jgi:hypothetical protein